MPGIFAKGGDEVAVSLGVSGADTTDKIGIYSPRVKSEIALNKWIKGLAVYGSSDLDTLYTVGTIQHDGGFYFDGMLSVKYRAVIVAYVKNVSGYKYSKETACTGRYCG